MENYEVGGVTCLIGEKVKRIREISDIVTKEASRLGYMEVMLPSFEEYDLYKKHRGIDALKMIKTIDNDGRVLVLRPDATVGITKFVTANFPVPDSAVKLFYISTIYREYKSPKSIGRDFLQAGVEYFGDAGLGCECEAIGLAVDILHRIGVNNLQLGLGSASYLNGFLDTLNLRAEDIEQVLEYIEGRNLSALVPFLKDTGVTEKDIRDLVNLISMVGTVDAVLPFAKELVRNEEMEEALKRLTEFNDLLKKTYPRLQIKLDISLTARFNYYTDTIFELFAGGMHVPVISGGRYDSLAGEFGEPRPAFGFGLNINMLLDYDEEEQSRCVRLAIAKGRVAREVMDFLQESGINFPDYDMDSRKLRFFSDSKSVEVILVKSMDVPTYVESGAADLGIVGSDVLYERDFDGYILKSTEIGKCRMSVAKLKTDRITTDRNLMVASKYPKITSEYLKRMGVNASVIRLDGSVELGPIVGLSDVVVDIVQSGETLRENGLEELDTILEISSQIICNKVAFKTKQEDIEGVLEILMKL